MRTIRPRKEAQAAFAIATLFLLLSGVAATFSIVRLRSARNWVNHTYEVQNALANVNTLLSRSGRLRAEYVDSGDPAVLRERDTVVAQIPQVFSLLRSLTLDNPSQQESCDQVEALTSKRIALMRQSIELKQANESTLEKQYEVTRQIVIVAGQTDAILQQMESAERVLLKQRSVSAERVFWWAVVSLLATLIVALALFLVNYRLLSAELDARLRAQDSLRTLSARLLRLQDDERRKFARELHDSLGQYLSGLKMLLPTIGRTDPDPTLAQCLEIVDQSLAETRTISHLLHPPLLDEAGLRSAVSWYVEGFAQRSGVQADLDMPADLGRLPSIIELALFRVIQEALTNIHRHANATHAEIKLTTSRGQVTLLIKDTGHGIPPAILERFRNEAVSGVGLAGMRERIRELGGQLDIESSGQGTVIRVTMPVPDRVPSTAA